MLQATVTFDPLALGKAVDRVVEKRDKFDSVLNEVRKLLNARPKLDLKEEIAVLTAYDKDVLPALRERRRIVLENRGQIDGAYLGYIDALAQAIETLHMNAAAIDKRLKSDKDPIKSTQVRDNLIVLAGASKSTAEKFSERLKSAQADLVLMQEVLATVNESGLVLDFWDGQVKAMLVTDQKGELARKTTEGLRDFIRGFQDAFDRFLDIHSHIETSPQPAVPSQEKKS